MKRKSICLIFWILLATLAYGSGYLCFAWPLSNNNMDSKKISAPVTAGKENYILPETRLIMQHVNLKTGEKYIESLKMPAVYLGLEREELLDYLNQYTKNLSYKEREDGLVAFELESYSVEEIVLKKLYYPDENFTRYYMIYKHGRMVVYYSDHKTVYDYPDVKLYDLPLDIQCKVIAGMEIKDDVELYDFLQNYSS